MTIKRSTPVDDPELRRRLRILTPVELAAMLGIDVSSVDRWRFTGTGPQYTRLGRRIYYREYDVAVWIEENVGRERGADTEADEEDAA